MKILYLDIETLPLVAEVWGLRDQNIGLNQIIEQPRTVCYGYKWADVKTVGFKSAWEQDAKRDHFIMWGRALLNQADVVVHYNGMSFDIPWMNTEFAKLKLTPPSPYKQIDLYRVVRKNFKLPSYKLEYVAHHFLGIGEKVSHEGHALWTKVRAGDPKAQKDMEKYCKQDVKLLPRLYTRLLPWITNHPNHNLYTGQLEDVCPNCGGNSLLREGFERLQAGVYQRYSCKGCGRWSRGRQRLDGTDIQGAS